MYTVTYHVKITQEGEGQVLWLRVISPKLFHHPLHFSLLSYLAPPWYSAWLPGGVRRTAIVSAWSLGFWIIERWGNPPLKAGIQGTDAGFNATLALCIFRVPGRKQMAAAPPAFFFFLVNYVLVVTKISSQAAQPWRELGKDWEMPHLPNRVFRLSLVTVSWSRADR